MINRLFSIFDPSSSFIKLSYLYSVIFILFILLSVKKSSSVNKQIIASLKRKIVKERKFIIPNKKGNNLITITLFMLILLINVIALFPQNFPNTSQVTLNVLIAIILWISTLLFGMIKNTKRFLIHLVPQGTPTFLINFIVLIELVRILIRPITLSVRLTANILAGHLLISLLRDFLINRRNFILISMLPFILTILERAVAFIQAYVFVTLVTLYATENQYVKKISSISHSRKKTLTSYRIYFCLLFNFFNNYLNKYKSLYYTYINIINFNLDFF